MKIFVLNAGSSSFKCAIFQNNEKIPLWTGILDWGKNKSEVLMAYKLNGKLIEENFPVMPLQKMMKKLIKTASLSDIDAIGHRVVHGGEEFCKPVIINSSVKRVIKKLIQIAPLHNPANLEGIEIMEKLFPGILQIAVFDTAFHSLIPDVASTYALPKKIRMDKIKKYGFHGISHEYCMNRALKMLPKMKNPKMICCHLGNGASLAAIQNGHSIDTTMGFTPMEGLMMGTRSGSIDPGILIYLLKQKKMNVDQLNDCLNYESGLKGVSGGFSDMRTILTRMDENDPAASLAFDMFIYSITGFIAKMAASLQGLELLIFTAGIGENSPKVRLEACQRLKFLGIEIDKKKNVSCIEDEEISTKESKVCVLVIHTKEEWSIAQKCLAQITNKTPDFTESCIKVANAQLEAK